MPNVNPEILAWARKTAGLSEDEAVRKLDLKDARGVAAIDRLALLESGEVAPTRAQLVKMSKQYRRPLLTFYLDAPPRTGDRGEDFRTLPDNVERNASALADAVIRDIRARQSLIKTALEDDDEGEALPFIGSLGTEGGIDRAVAAIRQTLQFEIEIYRAQQKIEDAFAYLRGQAEQAGVFVLLVDNLGSHHSTIDVEVFRGFALADPVAPFVAVNANDSKGAWSFTLLHELTHLWLGASGVSGSNAERKIEKFCNDVASEFLLPRGEMENLVIANGDELADVKEKVSAFARARHVSSTMAAYKLYRINRLSYEQFFDLKSAYRTDFLEYRNAQRQLAKGRTGGPSYHIVRQHRLGTALIRLVNRMLYSGTITTTKAGKVLGVKPKNVSGVLKAGAKSEPIEIV